MGIDVTGLVELRARLNAMKERAANPGPGLLRAGMVVVAATKAHIKSGGPGWPPNQSGTPLLFKTGRLMNSITVNVQGDTAEVGTNVFYAKFMQFGTGVYAGHGRIYPTHAKALAFDGRFYRSIKGSPARKFLYLDAAQSEKIREVFANYIVSGLPQSAGES